LEGELWEDWDNRQASFEDYYDWVYLNKI
jgi:hypothetical protein